METTTIRTTDGKGRGAAVNALAIVGFIVLIIIGMVLAVYAATFVPAAISRIGAAAVYFSGAFVPNEEETDPNLVVVPGATVPFEENPGTPSIVATTTATTSAPATPAPTAGTPATTVVQVPVAVPVEPSGLPDLTIENVTTGYLNTTSTESFRSSDEVPDGKRAAVKFSVVNRGTNVSGRFTFEAELPTTRTYTFESGNQASLNPGERIDYVLGFDRTRSGNNRTITIEVDHERDIRESDENNNTRNVSIDIED